MGCGSEEAPPGVVLPVNVHTLPECDVTSQLAQGSLELQALGDFQASNDTAEVLPIDARGTALRFPLTTRAIEARITGAQQRFIGYGERLARNRYDVLLWRELEACLVFRPDGPQGYPGKGGGQALGYARSQGLVFAAGGNDVQVSDAIVGALSFQVTTGAVTSFDTSPGGSVLREARAFATVSELGDKLLVAGGEDPAFEVPEADRDVRDTAEIFDPATGSFVGELITLHTTRTRHAAVALSNGNTLLVGGRGRVGDMPVATPLAEVISAKTLVATPAGTLAVRIGPRAVRLSDGRVFVGGGSTLEGAATEPAGEWLMYDGRNELVEAEQAEEDLIPHVTSKLPARFERAFVAMPGSGVLAVGGCEDRESVDKADAVACGLACSRGCPPGGGYDAWWLDADGREHELSGALDGIVAPQPILLPGSDGSPWLIAARENEPETPRLFRFNPWTQTFAEADIPTSVRLPRPGFPEPVAIDPDAFVWLDESDGHGELFGLRLGTRNRYTQDLALVLLSDPEDPTRPLHLVPDRPLAPEVGEQLGERYDGRLWLLPMAGLRPLTVSVADTDYEDVTVLLKLSEPEELLEVAEFKPPHLVLGDVELGGPDYCPWPTEGDERGGDADIPTLVRRGARVELRYHGETRSCAVPEGRLGLALRTGDGVSIISELEVQRGAN